MKLVTLVNVQFDFPDENAKSRVSLSGGTDGLGIKGLKREHFALTLWKARI